MNLQLDLFVWRFKIQFQSWPLSSVEVILIDIHESLFLFYFFRSIWSFQNILQGSVRRGHLEILQPQPDGSFPAQCNNLIGVLNAKLMLTVGYKCPAELVAVPIKVTLSLPERRARHGVISVKFEHYS